MNLRAFVDIFINPVRVFSETDTYRRSTTIMALVLEIAAPIVLIAYYYHHVNFSWLVDLMSQNSSPSQSEAAQSFLSPSLLTGISALTFVVTIPLFTAILAVYFYIVAKAQGLDNSYGQWFGATVWASLPSILLLPLGVLSLEMSPDGRVPPTALNPTSFNQLILRLDDRSGWLGLAESVSVPMLWTIGLLAVAYRHLARSSTQKSVLIAAAPYVVVYAIWAVIILSAASL